MIDLKKYFCYKCNQQNPFIEIHKQTNSYHKYKQVCHLCDSHMRWIGEKEVLELMKRFEYTIDKEIIYFDIR